MKALTTLLAVVALSASLHAAPQIGQSAPDFTLKDLSGKEHKLSDYKGKNVVLEWINFGCPFVKKHYEGQTMQNLQKSVTQAGDVWLTICSSAPGKQGNEKPEDASVKIREFGAAPTAYLRDEDGAVGRLYEAQTTPQMFVIDKEGTLAYSGAIDDRPSPDPASLQGAKNYVLEAYMAVVDGKPVPTPQTKPYGCSVKY